MQFYLIASILLFAPLAFARLPASLTSRLLYDGGFAIGENRDGRYTQISSDDSSFSDGFYYAYRSNASFAQDWLRLEMKKGLTESLSFAVETWPDSDDVEKFDKVRCVRKSDESLRGLIKECFARIRLRSLTEEEKREVQKFKEEYKETRKPFTLIIDKREMKIKTTVMSLFFYQEYVYRATPADINTVKVYNSHDGVRKDVRFENVDMRRQSFAIEALPNDERNVDCKVTDVKSIYFLGDCHGNIRIRNLNENDLQ